MRVLVVKSAFQGHEKGSVIDDQVKIDEILKGDWKDKVILAQHVDRELPKQEEKLLEKPKNEGSAS